MNILNHILTVSYFTCHYRQCYTSVHTWQAAFAFFSRKAKWRRFSNSAFTARKTRIATHSFQARTARSAVGSTGSCVTAESCTNQTTMEIENFLFHRRALKLMGKKHSASYAKHKHYKSTFSLIPWLSTYCNTACICC